MFRIENCSFVPDGNEAAVPSEETIARAIAAAIDDGRFADAPGFRNAARAVRALFAPILAEKERAGLAYAAECSYRAGEWQARALAAEAALGPFANYHEDCELLDDKGAPLPDEQHAGYVYLTMGDFRRAKAALAQIAALGAAMEAL